jgi:TPR repeat protein
MVRVTFSIFCLALTTTTFVRGVNAEHPTRPTTPALLARYQSLSTQSNPSALDKFNLAVHLLNNSLPNSSSLAKVVTLLHSASAEGHTRATYLLAEFYQSGIHVNRDSERAEQLRAEAIRRDIEAGRVPETPLGLLSCGEMLRDERLSTVAAGLPDALAYSVGWCLIAGGHKERQQEGVRLAIRAAAGGDIRAQVTVGSLYESGSLLEKSPSKAALWYLRAFNANDRSSVALEAGYRYVLLWIQRLIPQDLAAVRAVLSDLVRYNHIEGKVVAAQLAFSEKLAVFAPEETFQLATDVATAGYGVGYLLTAACHERGIGTRQDWAKAIEFYRRAGEAGLPIGYARLGDIYALGLGRQPDAALALDAYQKAANLGYMPAEANLAALKRLASANR